MSQIASAVWSVLLDHANAIDFLECLNQRGRGRLIASSISLSRSETAAANSRSSILFGHLNSPI